MGTKPLTGAQQTWLDDLGKLVGVVAGGNAAVPEKERARGQQGPREKTEGQGEFIGSKGVLVFDFAPGSAALTPNQERVLMSQQVKFSSRGARVRIVGHSSAEEDASVAQKRAARRTRRPSSEKRSSALPTARSFFAARSF